MTSASSAEYAVASSIVDLVEADLLRALAGDLGVGDRLHVEMAPREVVHVVRPVRLEHVRLEQRVVRDAGERDAVVGEHVLVVLEVLPELLAATGRRTTARGARAPRPAAAGPARRDSGARAGCSRRAPGSTANDRPTIRAAIGSRLVVSVSKRDELRAADRGQPAQRAPPRRARSRSAAAPAAAPIADGGVARRRTCACPAAPPRSAIAPAASLRRVAAGAVAQPALELEALVERLQPLGIGARRCARSAGATGSAQSVLTVSSRRPCGSQSSVARRFSPTTPAISPACATTLSSVPYCVQPLRRGLRPDLRHAGHVVDGVAGQREQVEHLVGAHAELRDARPPRRASRCSSC